VPTPVTSRRWEQARAVTGVALIALVVVVALWLSNRYRLVSDWTHASANELSPPTRALLAGLADRVSISISAPSRGLPRAQLEARRDAFERALPNIRFRIIDPRVEPDLAQRLDVSPLYHGRVEYNGRAEVTKDISEQGLVNALLRVSQPGRRWVAYLEGHRERDLLGRANHDLGLFGAELEKRGLSARPVNLAQGAAIPANAAALVVAAPATPLLELERAAIERYLDAGGNLLWLAEPGASETGLLAERFGVGLIDGTVVTPPSASFPGLAPSVTLVSRYTDHAITSDFRQITLFPTATGLEAPNVRSGFTVTALLTTDKRSWVEAELTDAAPAYDLGVDVAGPVVLGIALEGVERSSNGPVPKQTPQRVIILADADFLSNRYLANQGNLPLGLRTIDWLAPRRDTVALTAITPPDASLALRGWALQSVAFFALLGFPALLAIAGFVIHWRRRRL